MDKIIKPIMTTAYSARPVPMYCRIRIEDKPKGRCLSICGVVGPKANGDAVGGCGQNIDELTAPESTPAKGWTPEMVAQLHAVWNRWHLNNMRAGTPEQMAYLDGKTPPAYPANWYTWACGELMAAGLYEVEIDGQPYKFGHAWLYEAIPDDVIAFLESLPASDTVPAWA